MIIYCMSRRELLKEISSWMENLEENKELRVKILRDEAEEGKVYILSIIELKKERSGE